MNQQNEIDEIISSAFREDIASGDITTIATVSSEVPGKATFLVKDEEGIIAGLDVTERVFHLLDAELVFKAYTSNGSRVKKGEIIAEVTGRASSILSAERTALNFLQRMSGIASLAGKFAEAVKGTKAVIIDTRKTVPGLRITDKLAVTQGGCRNHRQGLFDMFLIKDNHIAASGSITKAVEACRNYMKEKNFTSKIEVEVTNLGQTKEALESKADIIMLDNFEVPLMKEAVAMIKGRALVEASGGVNLKTVRSIAETGVDFISVGALTHSVKALDISLNLIMNA
ncbi:MAG: carboxylating nicotinate-nucleotide diphosphorylase [Ignavibacteria bacterium]|jgi:nicotinate-nucleotide pyrophosphorylase (carboxylating)|nr:carboxylating nicotinate-nucleotide diphosphorylase [Ignavibacteria bacterium]MCU7503113.1 carboxylating nicotinate-nucleotide diphosphorylase [Ignavibacteria bacterium]MCU7516467.1 carboxylating nicotinate-nucleotide diphosphorylase [Ignavibacteria bacterium]